MRISLKNYTLRYLTIAFLVILVVWTLLVGLYIYEEVFDDDDYKEELLDEEVLLNLAVAVGVLYGVLVLVTYLINLLLINKIWKPLKEIIEAIRRYQVGNKEHLPAINSDVIEFNVLHQNIEQMWERNEAMFEEQKSFTENASHELQTPLAITLNKLELLMSDEQLNEPQLLQLSQIRQSLMRMTHLNKSLLMLTRIENQQYKETERVSFAELLNAIIDDLTDLIEYKELKVTVEKKGDFEVLMHKDLATVLVSNLLRNAIKYNRKGGEITILLAPEGLKVQNSAQDMKALDEGRIFQRFHKGEQDTSSTGLGLAIVKSIADVYHLQINYRYEEEIHSFCLKRKLAN